MGDAEVIPNGPPDPTGNPFPPNPQQPCGAVVPSAEPEAEPETPPESAA